LQPGHFQPGHLQPRQVGGTDVEDEVMSTKISAWMTRGVAELKEFAPYAAAGLLLPGGSVIAVVAYIYRHHMKQGTRA
jgi:hypothetical protein